MKKLVILLLFFLILPALSATKSECVAVAESQNSSEELEGAIEDALDELKVEELEKYVQELFSDDVGIKERLLAFVKGGNSDFQSIFQTLEEVFFKEIKELAPTFTIVTAVALLCGFSSILRGGAEKRGIDTIVNSISFISCVLPIVGLISKSFFSAKNCVLGMKKQMEITFPLLLTLMAASGETVTVSLCKPSVAFLSTTMVGMVSNVVFPIASIIFTLTVADKISIDLRFSKIIAFCKSINKYAIGISVSIFGLFFTVQGITAVTYDGIARRAAKYAIGTGVPIVGGFLSGGFDLALAGGILIKNSLGYLGVVLLFASVFEPLILILATNLCLKLCAAITSPFADGKISDFLSSTADCLNYLTAGILFTAFLYLLSIVMIISTTGAFL